MRARLDIAQLLAAMALCTLAPPGEAQNQPQDRPPPKYSAEVGIGVEYDTNVSVDELDSSSGVGDYGVTVEGEVGVRQQLTSNNELSLSYDFSQTNYLEFEQVNRQTHILGANLETELGVVDSGLSTFYINSRLDGESFLELYRVSPSLSGFLGKRWFARGAYVYTNKAVAGRRERDSEANAGEADLYFFYQGLRKYFNFGYRFKAEDAIDAPLDFESHTFKLRYVQRIELGPRPAKLELGWRYEDRGYSSITPAINSIRADRRQRLQLNFELPVLEKAAVRMYLGYGNYDSNLQRADYRQTILGSKFLYRW